MSYQLLQKAEVTDRVGILKDTFLETGIRVSVERLKYLLEAYRTSGTENPVITRARVFDMYLRGMTLYVEDGNPIVGTQSQYRRGVNVYHEWGAGQPQSGEHTSNGQALLTKEERELLNESHEYFKDKSQFAMTQEVFFETVGKRRRDFGFIWGDSGGTGMGFAQMDYGKALNVGLEGIIGEAKRRITELDTTSYEEFRKRDFYKAVILSCEGVIAWANRYAELFEEMAVKEKNPQTKKDHLKIAEICRRVPAKPARTFEEAIQSFWFVHCAAWIECGTAAISPGRFPQYMYPFYKKDVQEGRITDDQVVELIELLFLKINELGQFLSDVTSKINQLHTGNNLTLGGFTSEGEDATNELDFLVLEAEAGLRLFQPSSVVVWHNKINPEFMKKCLEVVKLGLGKPAFINGHIAIQRHLDRWKCSMEEAYDISTAGCTQTMVSHSCDTVWGGWVNFPKILELVLNDGKNMRSGRQLMPADEVEKFGTFEELEAVLERKLRYYSKLAHINDRISENLYAEYFQTPFGSCLIDDCLAKGKDVIAGGARYASDHEAMVGVVDVANSMAAVKKLVFEEKKYTMEQVVAACRADFEGYADMHRDLMCAPKYGNEAPYVDKMVKHWYNVFLDEMLKTKSHSGLEGARPHGVVVSAHSLFGLMVGALPSGKKAGVALTDGSISATPGTDTQGPSALMHSAVQAMNFVKYSSTIFNLKFHPTALASDRSLKKLSDMIKTYMDMGGFHIQFNVVGAEVLRKAQAEPEKHKGLVVRVAGYSALFVNLTPSVQEEIIARTEVKL